MQGELLHNVWIQKMATTYSNAAGTRVIHVLAVEGDTVLQRCLCQWVVLDFVRLASTL